MIINIINRLKLSQLLIASHMLLVLVIILGLSWARYYSAWNSRVEHAANIATLAMNDVVSDISMAVSGNSYLTMLMPSAVSKFNSINSLIFFDVNDYSDYNNQLYGLRFYREQPSNNSSAVATASELALGKVWQTQITEQALKNALAIVEKIKSAC